GGDVITAFAGQRVQDGKTLQGIVNELSVGKSADASVVRDGKPLKLAVKIEEMPTTYGNDRPTLPRVPKADESAVTIGNIGAEVMDVDEDLAKQMGLKEVTSGAVVLRVKSGTPAAEAGLFPGLVITKADKKAVKSAAEFADAIKSGLKNGVLLRGESTATGTIYAIVKAGDTPSN